MPMQRTREAGWALILATARAAWPANALAQIEIKSRDVEIRLGGRLHAQWNTSSVSNEISNEFFVRRARIAAEIKVNDFVSGKIETDFAQNDIDLTDGYLRLTFDPAFRTAFGQFKPGSINLSSTVPPNYRLSSVQATFAGSTRAPEPAVYVRSVPSLRNLSTRPETSVFYSTAGIEKGSSPTESRSPTGRARTSSRRTTASRSLGA